MIINEEMLTKKVMQLLVEMKEHNHQEDWFELELRRYLMHTNTFSWTSNLPTTLPAINWNGTTASSDKNILHG
jgi:hypothetical protein